VSGADARWLAIITVELVGVLWARSALVAFEKPYAQDVVRSHVVAFLDDKTVVEYERIEAVADRLMDWRRRTT